VEKTAAEMKLGQIRLLLAQYESEYQVVYSTLKMWMNTSEDFTVDASEDYTPMNLDFIYDTAQLVNHPYLLSIQQQAIIADAQVNLQRKAVSPDLQAGYFNQSIIGVQNVDGTDISYSGDTRFQGFNLGIRLPIFFTGNRTKIESLTAKHQAMVMEAEFSKEKMQTELYGAFQKYNRYVDEYDYYRETTLPNADQLLNAAKAGYTTGDTGYLEYIIVVQFVSDTRIRFLERIHELNQTIFQIQYLLQQ
jgi:cobalt-zinc-cadmium resistance protein CzcA